MSGRAVAVGVLGALVVMAQPAAAAVGTSKVSAADKAIITAATLQLSDFPSGWRAGPASASSSLDDQLKGLPACRKIVASEKRRGARAKSDEFSQSGSDTEKVAASVSVYPAASVTRTALNAFRSPDAVTCLNRAVALATAKAQSSSSASLKTSVGRLSIDPAGDDAVGFEVALKATQNRLTVTEYLDVEFVQVGRAGITFETQSLTPDASRANDVRATALPALIARIRAAGA